MNKILNVELLYDPAIALPAIQLREMKTHVHTMFIAALFIIAQQWKQTKYLTTDEQMNRKIYSYNECGHQMNEILLHVLTTWMKFIYHAK